MNSDMISVEQQAKVRTQEALTALREIAKCIRRAKRPFEVGDDDPLTVQGELEDMDYHLSHARFAVGSIQDVVSDLTVLIGQLRGDVEKSQNALVTSYLTGQQELVMAMLQTMTINEIDRVLAVAYRLRTEQG